ncbi:putative quinol monooxygenase [Psittacicella hinzii]|nr:hypothetical protein [Psittacicella hinzii]
MFASTSVLAASEASALTNTAISATALQQALASDQANLTLEANKVKFARAVVNAPIVQVKQYHLVNQESGDDFDSLAVYNLSTSIVEGQDNLAMFLMYDENDPQVYYALEVFTDSKAQEEYQDSESYKFFQESLPTLVERTVESNATPEFMQDREVLSSTDARINVKQITVQTGEEEQFATEFVDFLQQEFAGNSDILSLYVLKVAINKWLVFTVQQQNSDFQLPSTLLAKVVDSHDVPLKTSLLMNQGVLKFAKG